MVFLLSTFARYDVALALVLTAVGGGAHDLAREHPRWSPMWHVVSWFLPPYGAFSDALNFLSQGNSSAALAAVLPAFAYGAAYVAAAVAIIRRRSIAN
jgi:hypothetical protein